MNKWEQTPSQIYSKIRKMREDIDQMQLEEKLKQKKKEKELADANQTCIQRGKRNK